MTTIIPTAITYVPIAAVLLMNAHDDATKRKTDPATGKQVEDQHKHEGAASTCGASKPDEFFVLMTQKLRRLDAKITGLAKELRRRDSKRK